MSNSRFLTNNRAIGKTVLNGSGGGAPSRDETSTHPMENALQSDRYTPWLTAAAPAATINFDIDLGSSIAITTAAILGYRNTGSNVQVTVQAGGGAYPPGAWNSVGSISLTNSPRDMGVVFGSVSARYWRFKFEFVSTQFSVGKVVLGVPTDLGFVHAPGGESSPYGFRLEQTMLGGATVLTELSSDRGRDISLPFNAATESLRSTLATLAALSGPFLHIDAADAFYEVYCPDKRLAVRRQFMDGSSFLYDIEMKLRRLP